jgi:transposase
VTCYEAGPLGCVLHRQLTELGVTNYVIRPRNWDDQSKRVKTDRSDACSMLSAPDRFLAGNTLALTVVRVPEIEQERRRSEGRIRESLQRQLKAATQRGRGWLCTIVINSKAGGMVRAAGRDCSCPIG